MAPYQLTIAYDGTEFYGFQRQKNKRTVQDELEKALRTIGWQENSILSAGRTDTGVHAEGQVISFQLAWAHRPVDLAKALNDKLPRDISIKAAKEAKENFHPRFDARNRKYRYQVFINSLRDPVLERYYWRVWPKPDESLIKTGISMIIGDHDFASIGKPPKDEVTTIRTIFSADWNNLDTEKATFTITSKAFLYHMVRRIVFLLIRIGQQRIDALDLEKSLLGQKDLPAGIAPAHGLFLEEVIY